MQLTEVIKGTKFDRWSVLRTTRGANNLALCLCACGIRRAVRISNLIYGNSRSCGCRTGDRMRTHGKSGTAEHTSWEQMLSRCYNRNHRSYENYGGRGIKVCKRWRRNFENFLNDVGHRPSSKHSLDRFPDMNGNYKPSNVRWATRTEQNQNTNRNVMLTFRGETRCVSDWARILNIGKKTISCRLERGWTVKEALTIKPVRTRNYGTTWDKGH